MILKKRIIKEKRGISRGVVRSKGSIASILFLSFFIFGVSLNSCKSDLEDEGKTEFIISNFSITSPLEAVLGENVVLSGQGFANGDKIKLSSPYGIVGESVIEVSSVTDDSATFSLPSGIISGKYDISVLRGNKEISLGSFTLKIIAEHLIDIPDKEGMTINGFVSCDGVGVSGVVVSDGYEVTMTDENGIYYLPSEKKHEYVFISVPGNYEVVESNKNLPLFFQRLSGSKKVEQKNFALKKVDNTHHVVLAMADWHLGDREHIITQFREGFLVDVNKTIADYKAKGVKVYGLSLGDLTWETNWYKDNYALPEYLFEMNKIDCPFFNVMGNHDNDPYFAGDWKGALTYKQIVGPNYYSFNLGDIHYIALDDINYINTGGTQGKIGDGSYRGVVVPEQMEWLKKDLATIKDKSTPIVIGMHIPMYVRPTLDLNGNQINKYRLDNGSELYSALSGFSNVRILSGHIHENYIAEPSSSLMEYNLGSVCATWWWTGKDDYARNHICRDGSPGGYGVWEMDGTDMKPYYKSIGYEKEYQFRAYDLNSVHITSEKYAPKTPNEILVAYAGGYATPNNNNEVLINVWSYDSQWKVEVKENGLPLTVKRIEAKDPLHIISYNAKQLDEGLPKPNFETKNTVNFFKVKASSPSTTLEIKVTDRCGRVYTETMHRPKEFTYLMR